MKCMLQWVGMFSAFALAACQVPNGPSPRSARSFHHPRVDLEPASEADADDDGDETRVSVDQIPSAVRAAAIAALPGLVIEEAELEDAGKTYCVHGTVDGKFHEVEVYADGTSANVEQDDGDDEGEADDD